MDRLSALSRAAGALLGALWAALSPRLGPFLDLLDARYLPLILVVSPQAWTMYAWLVREGSPEVIARMGAVGYESIFVGAIAWAERGAGWRSARLPAVTALLFAVAVAVAYYGPGSGTLAIVHIGSPLVAYAYTLMMHAQRAEGPGAVERLGAWVERMLRIWRGHPADAPAEVRTAPAGLRIVRSDAADAPAPAADAPEDLRPAPAEVRSYTCVMCGGPVTSAQARSSSGRHGCKQCKGRAA